VTRMRKAIEAFIYGGEYDEQKQLLFCRRHLACCRAAPARGLTPAGDAGTAWRYGLRLGLHCSRSCAGLTAILLVIGVMDLRVMALVTAAITAERLAPGGERVARAIGVVAVGAGVCLIARALG